MLSGKLRRELNQDVGDPSEKSAYEALEKLAHTAEEVKHLDVSLEFYQ